MLLNIVMGFAAGTLCAIGGAIKDGAHEGFKPVTFWRSPMVGIVTGALTILWTDNPWVAFMCAGYMERCAVEAYKIVRHQPAGKHSWKYSEWPWLWSGQRPIESPTPEDSA